ncbi:13037_t:CDS:1, partial [Dentiscutata erythropus]
MATDQKHLSDSVQSLRDQIIRCTEKIARISGLNEQNLKVYSMLSGEIRALDKKLDDYHSEYNSLKKIVKRLERDVRTQKIELENMDECVDRDTVVDLIHEIVPLLLINKRKGEGSSYSSETSEESDLVEIIE